MLLKSLRLSVAIFWFIFCCLIGLFLGLLRPFHPTNMRFCGRLFGLPLIKAFGIDMRVKGIENLDSRPCVIVSNHQNNMDLIAMGAVCPPRTVTLGKIEILFIPLFGLVYWLCGNILIVRGNKRKSRLSMLKVTETIRNKDTSVWVMPEGTRSRGRGLLPFKSGAFRTAIDAQVPIVPICLNNYHHLVDLSKAKAGVITCEILPPIKTEGLTRDDLMELTQKCRQNMAEVIERLDRESQAS